MARESLRDSMMEHAILHAERLVAFLNTPAAGLEVWRATQIFELCQHLNEHVRAPKPPEQRQITGLLRSINAHLEMFHFIPVLSGHDPLFVFWRDAPKLGAREVKPLTGKELSAMPVPTFHLDIIRLVLNMTEAGTVGRIRRCICGKWFFAQTNKKQVCSDACRFQKFQNLKHEDPQTFKKKHADYMRDWRNNPKVKGKRRKANDKTN